MDSDYTWLCDEGNCEHETDIRHVRGVGVFCGACSARRIALAFDPDEEEAQQGATANQQRFDVSQQDE